MGLKSDVRTWQLKMKDRGWRLRTDGVFDKDAEQVCVQFHRERNSRSTA
ncbi:hypothetical protein [Actinoplanes sp. NPDC023714]